MQVRSINRSNKGTRRGNRGAANRLLLVGSEEAFRSVVAHRIISGHLFRVVNRVATLLEGLASLESKAIDLVLLSHEFREEEQALFAFAAQKRGCTSLILRVASFPVSASQPSRINAQKDAISFTTKQQAVLDKVSEGWSNHQIAAYMNCTEGSIKAILQKLFAKLGVRRRAQLVRLAYEATLARDRPLNF